MSDRFRVLIVGGGYGGLYAAKALDDVPVDVTLVDRRNHHVFSPLLYQVATGALAPSEIAQPLRSLLRRRSKVRVLLGEAVELDPVGRAVGLADGTRLGYDALIVASGTRHAYFGHDEWAAHAPGLKTIEDALEMRARILAAFEEAELESDPGRQRAWMSFVIVGGGPTGVELAGALAEIARDTLPRDFRAIDTESAQVHLVEAADRVLPTYPPSLSASAERQLRSLGVTVLTGAPVVAIDDDGVTLGVPDREAGPGPGREPADDDAGASATDGDRITARTVLWAAGVTATGFGRAVAEATGAPTDRVGRIIVEPDLTIPGHDSILVVGDLASVAWKDGGIVPGVAQGGIQGGRYAARAIAARLDGERIDDFRYRDLGELATIGRLRAVADLRRVRVSGVLAWLMWLGIHIFFLIGLQNRILVMVRWTWAFITKGRGSRLITGPPARARPR